MLVIKNCLRVTTNRLNNSSIKVIRLAVSNKWIVRLDFGNLVITLQLIIGQCCSEGLPR